MTGVVVDVDDTLYLERDYVRSGFTVVGEWCRDQLGVEGVGERAWSLFTTGRRATTLTDALRECGIQADETLTRAVVQVYRQHPPAIGLLPDAGRFLRRAILSGPVGVITDGPAESQHAKCQALGLADVADPIVITADMATSKPDPAVYARVADAWDLPPEALVYVADNPVKDFVAPVDMGWRAVRIRRPGALHSALASPPGVLELGSLDELDLSTI